jgi:hypothetical protein
VSGLEIAVVALVAVWLGVLTIGVLLCIRQIALLTLRFDRSVNGFSVANDGPDVGTRVPDELVTRIPELADARASIVLISSTCAPCRELAEDIRRSQVEDRMIALVTGPDPSASSIEALLYPQVRVIRDPDAASFAEKLHIHSTPFAVRTDAGEVVAKTYLHRFDDFKRLVNAQAPSLPAFATEMEVNQNGR